MNGYLSQAIASVTASALSRIQRMTMPVCPTMNVGVPKKRAKRSACTPKVSPPKGRWWSGGSCEDGAGSAAPADGCASLAMRSFSAPREDVLLARARGARAARHLARDRPRGRELPVHRLQHVAEGAGMAGSYLADERDRRARVALVLLLAGELREAQQPEGGAG